MLKSVSRSLSDVGRSPSHVGAFSRLPFSVPAITRIFRSLPAPPDLPGLPDLDQFEALLPIGKKLLDRVRRRRERLEPPARLLLREHQHLVIANQINHAERRYAGLSRPEEISGAAQPQIALGDLESVRSVRHGLQSLARFLGERRLVQQEAVRLMPIAADAPAQ